MLAKIKYKLGHTANCLEIILSIALILAIAVFSLDIFKTIYDCFVSFITTGEYTVNFYDILSSVIKLIIAVEFIKMLAKHSPASVVEVVLFVIAKSVIIDDSTALEMLLGVLSIAVIFAVRKYLFTSGKTLNSGFLFKGSVPVRDVCSTCKVNIPEYMGDTLCDVIEGEFMRLERPLREHESLEVGDAVIMIHKISEHGIDILEVWKKEK